MICRHGDPGTGRPCGRCPCPAGGGHDWGEADSGDAFAPSGGGPGTRVHRWVECQECHALPPEAGS